MKSYVAGFIRHQNEIILIEKQKPDWQKGKLNGIGGSIEEGESILEAIRRECVEEVGYHIDDWEYKCRISNSTWEVFFLIADVERRFQVPGHLQTSTEEQLAWYPIHPLPAHVIGNLHFLVPLCFYNQLKYPISIPYQENK